MSGITNLTRLLATASPLLLPGRFVFVTVTDPGLVASLDPVGIFRENEGTTAICLVEQADRAGLPHAGCYRQITMQVHSSLEAVGFIAAVASVLARAGIPCNAISAYYHDHLFVPEAQAGAALAALQQLAGQSA